MIRVISVAERNISMGKPTGFMEYLSRAPSRPLRRRADAGLPGVPSDALRGEAAESGCPLHELRHAVLSHRRADQRHGVGLSVEQPDPGVEQPGLQRSVGRGAAPSAARPTTSRSSPARVCPAPCEGSCTLAMHEEAGDDQADRVLPSSSAASTRAGSSPSRRELRTGKRVAVVGSGPSGLAAARIELNKAGPLGHGLRARRSHRRAADVRHPQHEARQTHRGAAG